MKVGEAKLPLTSSYLSIKCKQMGNEIPEATLQITRHCTEPGCSPGSQGISVPVELQTLTGKGLKNPDTGFKSCLPVVSAKS